MLVSSSPTSTTAVHMSRPVELKVYDLSGGLAAVLSEQLLGKKIDGIWHTGVVVGGIEYFFGQGIQQARASASPFGNPLETISMGHTEVPDDMVQDFLRDISPKFNASTYDLMQNNCNNFSDALCEFLVGKSIPSHITGLPQDVLNSPMGPMLVQMLQPGLEAQLGNATASGVSMPAAPRATGAPKTSAAPQQASTPHTTTNNSSNGAQSSTKGLQNGSAGASRKKYKATLEEHFKKIMEGGETDANKAAVEAVKHVSALVREGKVEPPEPVSALA